jgi:hypothetical protein
MHVATRARSRKSTQIWATPARDIDMLDSYWDFSKDNTVAGFAKSPLFDKTYGLGGNGPYIADVSDPVTFPVKTPTLIPNRTGGGTYTYMLAFWAVADLVGFIGCLDNGPFSGLTVNMGMGECPLQRRSTVRPVLTLRRSLHSLHSRLSPS